ncbi:hypothetical protein FF38_07909 [Lucilia cuprina]|uniref:Uncharacterized protein n=1 Tax=Lucilia cuprina TaxID=7375 RepID=A0A0L0BLA9_LUCCU|nr:hypothetical protein FF38_07909 [Lucilia cuprina]
MTFFKIMSKELNFTNKEIEEEEMLDAVTFPIDEIPEPIKVLDDIISEFEDLSLRPQLQNNGENQSEDDGYMSLSRKK